MRKKGFFREIFIVIMLTGYTLGLDLLCELSNKPLIYCDKKRQDNLVDDPPQKAHSPLNVNYYYSIVGSATAETTSPSPSPEIIEIT